MLERVASLTWRRPKLVLALVGAFVALAVGLGHDVEHHLKAAGFTDPTSESERATELLRSSLGYDANPGLIVLVRPKHGGRLDLADPAVRGEIARLGRAFEATRHIGKVDPPLPAKDGRSVVLAGHLAPQDIEDKGGEATADARRRMASSSLAVSFGGFAPSFDEVNDQTETDLKKAELIAFPLLALLLLLVFRGVVAAGIPLLLGGISILGTFLVLRVMSSFVDTSVFALNISTGLSLGLAVDYALLMVSRYREELDRGSTPLEAHRRTVATAGRTSLFSGFTVAAAMAALIAFPQRFLYSVGVAGASVGIISALIAVLVVPSLLAVLGPRINALSVRRGPAVSADSGGWHRLAAAVMRRPVIVAVLSGGLMLAAASPLLGTTLTGPSAEAVPPSQPSYATNAYVDGHYGRELSEAITVAVNGPATRAELAAFAHEVESTPGIAAGTPFRHARDGVAYANFAPDDRALSGRSQDAVRAIRDLPPPAHSDVLVSGNTARFIDEADSIIHHLPEVIGIVGGMTILLLFGLTGSIVLPIKTLLMNALTLAATLGIVVLAFQHGVLDGLFDYTGPAAVELTSLVFLFAVTFGLATDYAVLVMARIKEQHDLGEPNAVAVATGIGRTGRVISAAAVMIAVVFLAFGVSNVFFMKQIAVGQAAGVLIDATIVRALLVPALMRLFGEWNWWAPAPLARLQARWGFQEG